MRALVMELVEGEDLAERLKRGPLPLDEALAVARQIAEALEAAHEKGIVHRDLKPANVKLTPDGKVKVLDFGLAKAMDPPAGSTSAADLARSPTLMNSPTMTAAHGTQLGVILGTAAYMSPEQARGQAVDKRADIWAFGVVLHEMLTGRSLFAADTVTDTLAGVLKNEIDLAKLPAGTPASVRRLLRRCLERNPKDRLHDIADARIELLEATSRAGDPGLEPSTPQSLPRRGSSWRLPLVTAVALALGLAAGWFVRPAPMPAPPRSRRDPRARRDRAGAGRRRRGTRGGFSGRQPAGVHGARRRRRDAALRPVPGGGESPRDPVFGGSPVSVLVAGQPLSRVLQQRAAAARRHGGRISAGPGAGERRARRQLGQDRNHRLRAVVRHAAAPDPRAGRSAGTGLGPRRQAVGRDQPIPVVPARRPALPLRSPRLFRLDARFGRSLRRLARRPRKAGPAPGARDATRSTPPAGCSSCATATSAPSASIPDRMALSGPVSILVRDVRFDRRYSLGVFSAAAGVLALQHGAGQDANELVWLDRTGRRGERLGGAAVHDGVELSPDATQVLVSMFDPATSRSHLEVFDLARKSSTRLTFGEADDYCAIWSPDGTRVLFARVSEQGIGLWVKPADGSTAERRFRPETRGELLFPLAWSPDGSRVLFSSMPGGRWPPDSGPCRRPARARPSATPTRAATATSGCSRPTAAGSSSTPTRARARAPSWPASPTPADGGSSPRTRPRTAAGREGDERSSTWPPTRPRRPRCPWTSRERRLASACRSGSSRCPMLSIAGNSFDVTPDGERFLFVLPVPDARPTPYTLILNWERLLEQEP